MDQNTFTLLTGGRFLYIFLMIISFENLREKDCFAKKIAKVRELVDAMHEKIVPKGVYVIREGILVLVSVIIVIKSYLIS